MLRNGIGRVSRHSDHVDFAGCVFDINVVEACATQCDNFNAKLTQLVNYGSVNRIVYKNANAVKPVRKLCRISVKLRFKIFYFNAVLLAVFFKRRFVIRFCVKKCDFYFRFLP